MNKLLVVLLCGWWMPCAFAERIVVEKGTGKLIEYQSDATPGTLTTNAINAGYAPDAIEEKEVTPAEWTVLRRQWIEQPEEAARQARKVQRQDAIDAVRVKLGLTESEFATLKDALR